MAYPDFFFQFALLLHNSVKDSGVYLHPESAYP